MLKKLRLKFVCITMTIVTVMLCVIFALVLHFTAQNLSQQSLQMLRQVAEEPLQMGRPGSRQDQILLPYFSLHFSPGGDVVISGGEYFDLSDEDFLQEILEQAAESEEDTGVLAEYDLRYYRSTSPFGASIVFADISSERQTLESLLLTCIAIGVTAFAALLVASLLLARWTVKPVEKAWTQQRQFVADASHELKTPLTVIMTNAELLASSQPEDDRRGQFVDNIQVMARQMRGLVEGLLELARVDNGAVKAAFSQVELSSLVSDTVLPFEAVFFEAGLELDSHIQPGIRVSGSAVHLCQVVEILLDNARKYSEPGSRAELHLEKTGMKDCLLSLSNRGQEIPQEELKNIFKRFYRLDKARTTGGSYGLGLAIAQSIVADHKGKIWARSENGVNTFFVTLPTL